MNITRKQPNMSESILLFNFDNFNSGIKYTQNKVVIFVFLVMEVSYEN